MQVVLQSFGRHLPCTQYPNGVKKTHKYGLQYPNGVKKTHKYGLTHVFHCLEGHYKLSRCQEE